VGNGNVKKGGGGGGGRDMVLESRHLLGLFLGVVVICGVFFTLGFVMGRTQYDSTVRAATATVPKLKSEPSPAAAANPAMPKPSEWDFYRSAEAKKPADTLKPLETEKTEAAKPAETSNPAAGRAKPSFKPPQIPRGAMVLQVAALTRESDALALAEALQQKEYPAFVLIPAGDDYYRVQVGPYADAKSGDLAKKALERDGFKAIVKR
jgi:cell division septation protein DedD